MFDFSFLGKAGSGAPVQVPDTSVPKDLQTVNMPKAAPNPWYQNPGFWGMIGQLGGALGSGKTPAESMANLGKSAGQQLQAIQLNEVMNKLLSQYLRNVGAGTGVSAGTPSSLSDSPLLTSANVVGLSPEQVSTVWGSALKEAHQGRELDLQTARTIGEMAQVPGTIEYKEALTKQAQEGARKAEAERQTKVKRQQEWDETKKAIEEGKQKKPSFLDDTTWPIVKGMDVDTAERFMSDLIKERTKLGKTKKFGHYADTNKGSLITYNDSDEIIELPDETDPTKTRKILPGGKIGEIPIGVKKEGKDPATQVGIITQGLKAASEEMLEVLKKDYFASFKDQAKAAEEFNKLLAMFKDPNTSEAAWATLRGIAKADTRLKLYKRADELSRSLGSGTGFTGATDTGDAKTDKAFKEANLKSMQQWVVKNENKILAKLKGKPKGDYTFPGMPGITFSWDGKDGFTTK
jgi:hypothetical protein